MLAGKYFSRSAWSLRSTTRSDEKSELEKIENHEKILEPALQSWGRRRRFFTKSDSQRCADMSFLIILTQKTQYFLEHIICEYWKPLQTVLFAVWGYLAVVTVWHGPVMEHHHAKISQKSRFWWISKNSVQQAWSALGSDVRGLGRALRRLYLSNPPMRQLRTEQNWRENCERTSSRSKRCRNIKVFDYVNEHAKT